ncbi:MAG TPA: protein kinase [Pirellulales bacterium]|nr:protein kinase [Pirellulales bacterium]
MLRNCPPEPDLLAFHLGTLADHEVDRVAEHLETCSACEAVVRLLETEVDPLLAALRRPHSAPSDTFGLASGRRPERPEADEAAPVGHELPGYEILGVLGRGGMGVVYLARQIGVNRLVALKRLRTTNPKEAARARVEAEALGRLQHPYIVQIHEVVEHEGRVYLALEYVEGGSLQARLTGKPQTSEAAAKLIELVARGVHHAHLNGIVHRDLKPANILLARGAQESELCATNHGARTTSYGLPKIADFGIAKWLADDSGHTEHGDVLGTATYMAPEQAAGNLDQIGPATDIYSVGVVLYELLTGRVPLQGITTLETLALVRGEEPVSPRRLQPQIPRDLETICLKCLEKEPSARYSSAAALADDLDRFSNHVPIHARPITFWERGWKWAKRRPAVAALSLALVLVAVAAVAAVTRQWRLAEEQAANEVVLRGTAERNERKIERLSANMMLDRAAALCEAGDIRRGLLWMVEALDASLHAGDSDLARVARLDLAGWMPFVVSDRAQCSPVAVTAAMFDPRGNVLLTGGPDGQARRWDALTGQPLGRSLEHAGPIRACSYSGDGKTILIGCDNGSGGGEARVWHAATEKPLCRALMHARPVIQVAFCGHDQTFITVTADETRLWSSDGRPIGQAMTHDPLYVDAAGRPRPMTASVSPDGALIATGGSDLMVRLWNAATAEPVGRPLEATHAVVALAFSPDSKVVLAGAADGGVRMWDAGTGERRGESLKMRGIVNAVAFSPDGQIAAAAGAVGEPHLQPSGEVQLCQVETGQNLGAALAHPRPVRALAFSPGGRLLLTGCDDGQARFFLTATASLLGQPLHHEGPVTAVGFSADGGTAVTAIATGDSPACARLWQTPREQPLGRPLVLPGELDNIAFAPDGALLAGTRDGSSRRWELNGDVARRVPERRAGPLAAPAPGGRGRANDSDAGPNSVDSPDGGYILEADTDQHARLHDAATGKAFGPPIGGKDVCCIAFSTDDTRLAAGSSDGRIALWNRWPPLNGDPERVRLTIELLTGMELIAHESARKLSQTELEDRRRRLDELGGPCVF